MKMSAVQYVFAKNWPMKAYFVVAIMLGLWGGIAISVESGAAWGDWPDFLLVGVIPIVVTPLLAFFVSLPCFWFIAGPFYHWRACLNGAPFKVGDRVCILVGPHRGRITRVYSMWQGDQLRVELGREEEEIYKDVFSPTQIMKTENAEPSSPPNAGSASLYQHR